MYKIVIVDDEPVIRKGMQCLIDWEALDCSVVYEAGNGIEAKEYLDLNPVDIVITDIKMPGMDGLDLSKYIYENYPNISVIILTAFADFSYAQSAIRFNVVDFIMKTNPAEKIPDAVNKAKELIEKRKEQDITLRVLQERINENLFEIIEKFIKDIINGAVVNNEVITNKADELGIRLENYFLIAYEINIAPQNKESSISEEQDKFISAIKNFLSLSFKEYHHYTAVMSNNLIVIIVAFDCNDTSKCTQSLLMTCNEILSLTDGFMKFTLTIGISGIHNKLNQLPEAIYEANEAISGNFYNDNRVSVYLPKNEGGISRNSNSTYEYTDKIIGNIQSGNHLTAKQYLLELFDEFRNIKEPIENVKVTSMMLCSLCFRLLANYKLNIQDYILSDEANIYKQIQKSKSINNLSEILGSVIESSCMTIASNEKQYNYLVREVNKYISDNFTKNINLQLIADSVHVNSSYLSRLYKKETGESIIDVLNKYRIEAAKKLLRDPANRVFEVAASVGIEDPAYFTHVFTKYTGMSPKEYKTTRL